MDDKEMFFQFSTGNRSLSFSMYFRLRLWPSQHHIQWPLWASFPGVKRPEGKVNISKVRNFS